MVLTSRRIRRQSGARKKAVDKDISLKSDLQALLASATRGDPQAPLRGTCKSARQLRRVSTILRHSDMDLSEYCLHFGFVDPFFLRLREHSANGFAGYYWRAGVLPAPPSPRLASIGRTTRSCSGGGFGLHRQCVDDTLAPALLDRDGGVFDHLFSVNEVALVHRELPADADRPMRCMRLTDWHFFRPKRASMSLRRKNGMGLGDSASAGIPAGL